MAMSVSTRDIKHSNFRFLWTPWTVFMFTQIEGQLCKLFELTLNERLKVSLDVVSPYFQEGMCLLPNMKLKPMSEFPSGET